MKTLPVTKPSLLERGCECGVNLIFGPRLRVSKNARRARARRPVCRRGRVEARKSARAATSVEGAVGTVSLFIVFCELFCRHVRDLKIVICIWKLLTVIVVSALKALY